MCSQRGALLVAAQLQRNASAEGSPDADLPSAFVDPSSSNAVVDAPTHQRVEKLRLRLERHQTPGQQAQPAQQVQEHAEAPAQPQRPQRRAELARAQPTARAAATAAQKVWPVAAESALALPVAAAAPLYSGGAHL